MRIVNVRFYKVDLDQVANTMENDFKKLNNEYIPCLQEYIDNEAFESAKEKIVGKAHNDKGIGTLSEKTVHAIMKNYYEPNEDNHEVKIEGYVADIYNEQGIIEIQTRQFNKMRVKLSTFLNLYPVTIVYPMPYNKWVFWIDNETGETTKKRKAPKKWSAYDAFFELYKIKEFLKNPNLRMRLVLMDMEEYRLLNGWNASKKRGSTRFDRIPLEIKQEVVIEQPEDYMQFIPYEIEEQFTSKEFAKAAKIKVDTARLVLNILYYVGVVKRVGKEGNSFVYEVKD